MELRDNCGNEVKAVTKDQWLSFDAVRKSFPCSPDKLQNLIDHLSEKKHIRTLEVLYGERTQILCHKDSLQAIHKGYSELRTKVPNKTTTKPLIERDQGIRMSAEAFARQALLMAQENEELRQKLKATNIKDLTLENAYLRDELTKTQARLFHICLMGTICIEPAEVSIWQNLPKSLRRRFWRKRFVVSW